MPMDYEKRDTGRIPESVGTPLDMVFVQTIAGPDATAYPAEEDEPTTYYCGIMKGVTFDKEVGSPTLQGELTSRRDYVYNLCSGSYIEEDSIVAAFVKNGRLWTMDAVRKHELVIVCHNRALTTVGDIGSMSRIDPEDGGVKWTLDFPDDAYGQKREPCAATISSDGYIYALVKSIRRVPDTGTIAQRWFVDSDSHAGTHGAAGTTVGAVYKINRNGGIVDSVELPEMHSDCKSRNLVRSVLAACGSICVDPNDPDRIYVGADFDVNGDWLHRVDSDMNIVWSYGETFAVSGEIVKRKVGRTSMVHVSEDGSVWAYNDNDAQGTIESDSWVDSTTADGVYHVSEDGVLITRFAGVYGNYALLAAVNHPTRSNTPVFSVLCYDRSFPLALSFNDDRSYTLFIHQGQVLQNTPTLSNDGLTDLAKDFAHDTYGYTESNPFHSVMITDDVPGRFSKGFTADANSIGIHLSQSLPFNFTDTFFFPQREKNFYYPMMLVDTSSLTAYSTHVPWSGDAGDDGPISPSEGHPAAYAACSDVVSGKHYTVGTRSGLPAFGISRVSPTDPTIAGSEIWATNIALQILSQPEETAGFAYPWHVVAKTVRG